MQNTSNIGSHSFDKGLNKDLGNIFVPPNVWVHARNAINNSKTGDLGKVGNEPANELCIEAPYQIIGAIHLEADKWAIFSTNSTGGSEIGLYIESCCKYRTIVNDNCLNFSSDHLIKGVSRATVDCNFELYWDDGNNNSRTMTIVVDNLCDPLAADSNVYTNAASTIPWLQICHDSNNIFQTAPGIWPIGYTPSGCIECDNTPRLNCDKIRLAHLVNPICAQAVKGPGAGTLPNGSYMVAIAYAISEQKISDYYITNVVGLFDHDNTASSLEVLITDVDTRFSEMIVVLISMVNQQTVARQAGIYSTHQTRLSFDVINTTWPAVPIEQLPLMTPVANKSDAMYNVGDYLIRVGPTSKFDFNYQPLANQIRTKWVSTEYDSDYYRKAGTNTGYMRDEVYPFFIRWIYDTGDKSNDYHIPGRPAIPLFVGPLSDRATSGNYNAALDGPVNQRWISENTAFTLPTTVSTLPDGGQVIQEGYMGYWESSEFYPDDKPEVWNPSSYLWSTVPAVTPYSGTFPFNAFSPTDYDLCGKKIRHHKFPEDNLHPNVNIFNSGSGSKIRIMGVKFENVLPPRDNVGNLIPGIIGYEILRGTRNGNKTVVAKGIINNMGQYVIPGGASSRMGAYPNYPYNDLQTDPFLTIVPTVGPSGVLSVDPGNVDNRGIGLNMFSRTMFTFHSPETNFTNPYLNSKELKVYGEVNGKVIGKFEKSEKHPKEKLITDFSFFMAAIGGIGIASLAMNGQKMTVRATPKTPGYSQSGFSGSAVYLSGTAFAPGTLNEQPKTTDQALITASEAAMFGINLLFQGILDAGGALGANLTGISTDDLLTALNGAQSIASTTKALPSVGADFHQEEGAIQRMGAFYVPFFSALPMFTYYFTEGTDSIMEFIKAVVRYQDYALRYHSHGFYNNFQGTTGNGGRPWRREITEQQYLGSQLTDFGVNTRINNLHRSRTVALDITTPLPDPFINDRTRYRASDMVPTLGMINDPTKYEIGPGTISPSVFPGNAGHQTASSHYVALKQRIVNQYGQLTNIIQVPIPGCYKSILDPITKLQMTTPTQTQVLFGGDVYIGRYTEKNTFFYFYDWLYGQPDGAQLDYHTHEMVAYPRYWANFNQFETSDFTTSIMNALTSTTPTTFPSFPVPSWIPTITLNMPPSPSSIWGAAVTPSDYFCLDGYSGGIGGGYSTSMGGFQFGVKNAWFYLFNSGVRDFFVESEINLDYRDHGNTISEMHYDRLGFTDTKAMFDTGIIKTGNYCKYDQSLSIAKLFFNYASWGTTQSRDYNPTLAESCYVYRPRKLIYSLPAQFEGRKDNWLIFLANNYYEFLSRVTCIKPVNKSGALITFESSSPVEFQGLDQLQTDLGTKLTIGDGGLFSQPMQQIVNADRPYEYASCQDRLSVINTPAGLFWMSQNQGKIFHLGGGLNAISDKDLKWWFAEYLPYKLTVLFPTFQLIDNPVAGIGCQAIYDNQNGLAYFCKTDYVLREGYTPKLTPRDSGNIQYIGSNNFIYLPTGLQIELGDPTYFEDASWTTAYDVKKGEWLGWQDWHPELLIPGKNTFMSTKTNPVTGRGGVWIHNERCDLYCNYYGVDYPFEIEYMVNTPQQINTLRSIEYYMEVYKYDNNCYDRFHVLDYNFDDAVIYNTEQCSGLLRLTPDPRLDPNLIIQYPIINPTFIEILCSKVENKYRFNQFWDVTDDRGEYPLYPLPPGPQRMIWNTGANGYVKTLNAANLNYNKAELQRKKFRHYTNSVFLRKRVIAGQSMTYKMLVMIANNKQLYSPR